MPSISVGFISKRDGFAEIGVMSLELDITQTWTIAIRSEKIDFPVKSDLNLAVHGGSIVIMCNKEECQIPRINASIIEGGEEIL